MFFENVRVIIRTNVPGGDEMKKQLYDTMQMGESFTIIYRSQKNIFSKRKIKIIGMKEDYVVAYCFVRQAIRTFYIGNILAIEKMEVYIR